MDVRIVAATHRHLETMVAEGAFREEPLVSPERVPRAPCPPCASARGRPVLASWRLADRAGKRLGGAPLTLTASDIELLHASVA